MELNGVRSGTRVGSSRRSQQLLEYYFFCLVTDFYLVYFDNSFALRLHWPNKTKQVTWTTLLGYARQGMAHADPSLNPPDERDLPPPPNASTSIGLAANLGSSIAGVGTATGGTGVAGGGGGGGHHDSRAISSPSVIAPGMNKRPTSNNTLPQAGKYGGVADVMFSPVASAVDAVGGGVGLDSVDGHSSTAFERGGGRTTVSGGLKVGRRGGGGEGSRGGAAATLFDTEMEANRLAFVRHLQVCKGCVFRWIGLDGGVFWVD